MLETVERFEEDLTDKCRPHRANAESPVTRGRCDRRRYLAREAAGGEDPLMVEIDRQLKSLLGLNP